MHSVLIPITALAISALPVQAGEWSILLVGPTQASGGATIAFAPDGSVSGSTGCNRFQGQAVFDGAGIVFDKPLAMTRMACPGTEVTRQEDTIVALLQDRVIVSLNPFTGELVLSRGDLSLVAAAQPEWDDGGMRPNAGLERPAGDPPYLGVFGLAVPLDIRAEPSSDAPALAGVQSGTVLRNLGCSDHGGVRWCNVAPLSGAPEGWAPSEFLEPAGAALRAGQGAFDATSQIPCAKGQGAPTTGCPFGVVRGPGGSAVVVVRKPDGVERVLYFENGAFSGADSSQAGGGFASSSTRDADLSLIRVDDERYEIPDAVLFGG